MKQTSKRQIERIQKRRDRERRNLFTRLPPVYAASRLQGQRLLQGAGGLSIVEWRVLWDLFEAGPMSIRDLAEIQRTDHSQLSRALPAMRDKGLVIMSRDSVDGRQMLVQLTDQGQAAYTLAAPVMKKRRDTLKDAFSDDEIDTFIGLIDRLETFLRTPIENILESEPTHE